MLKAIVNKIKFWLTALIYSMKGADDVISTQVNPGDGHEIVQAKGGGGVFADMLEEKQTQKVQEVVDTHYRILKESEKYHVDVFGFSRDDDGSETSDIYGVTRKRTVSDFVKNAKVYDADKLPIKVIQDNRKISKTSVFTEQIDFNPSNWLVEDFDYETLITVKRDGFTPTFKFEKLVKRIVIKELNDKKSIIELYYPADPPQFGQIGRQISNKMKDVLNNKRLKDELVDICHIEFMTDKPWTSHGLHSGDFFEYSNVKLVDIFEYDGNIVLKYEGDIVREFDYVGDKFRTDSMDEKYKNNAPKGDAVNLFALNRKIKREQENESRN
jgi:hypothetical protein